MLGLMRAARNMRIPPEDPGEPPYTKWEIFKMIFWMMTPFWSLAIFVIVIACF